MKKIIFCFAAFLLLSQNLEASGHGVSPIFRFVLQQGASLEAKAIFPKGFRSLAKTMPAEPLQQYRGSIEYSHD